MTHNILEKGFSTRALNLHPMWQIMFQAPIEDIDRIFDQITRSTPLKMGKTDSNGFRSASGQEYYRPLEGAPTGAEDEIRKRPKVDEMTFYIPKDDKILNDILEAIYEVHSYYEPLIVVREVLRSETKGLDDSNNPHRWWNKQGDWKDS